ncbi:MAG: T9SS type A sorting domain-containing protein [Spirosomataceae bacterium]
MRNTYTFCALGLLLFICSTHTHAQPLGKLWDKRFGGTDTDGLTSMITTSDGGFLLGGYSFSDAVGDKSQASQGSDDYWVVKIDGSGNKLWDKRFGGASYDILHSIIATSDGGFLLGGYSNSGAEGDRSQASQGNEDFWIVKIDGSGNKLWDKRFGGASYDRLYSIIATPGGGFLLGGLSNSGAEGDRSQASQGNEDFWVVKIDGSGNKLWDKRFGGAVNDGIYSITATSDGGFLLGGLSSSGVEGDKSQASQGSSDYWVVKIDGSGNKLWDKRFGGAGNEYFESMIATTNGGFLLGGYTNSGAGGDKSQASQGGFDYWVVKIDGSGNKLWDKGFGGASDDVLRSMVATTDGGFLLGGFSASGAEGDKSEASQGREDYWVVKINGNGNKLWDKRFGGTDLEDFHSITATTDGGFLLGGDSSSSTGGDKSQGSRGSSDYWVIKVKECTLTAAITPSTPQIICPGAILALSGSSSGGTSPTYSWSAGGGAFVSNQQNPAFTAPTVGGAAYTLTLTASAGGCTATATVSISIQQVTVNISPNPLTVCLGQTINLSANASPTASAFFWKGPGNFSSTTQNISTYATTTANLGIYSVSATIGSCVVTTTAEIKSEAILKAGVIGTPCLGGTIQFTASGMTSYSWSRPINNFNSNLPNPVIPSSTMNDAGIYFLTARSGACVTSTLVSVLIAGSGINPSFSVNPSTIAAGATVALSAASATGVYSWSGPNGFSGNTRTKSIPNFQSANNGTYRLTLTVGTCTGYTEKNISINSATRLAAAETEPIEMEINAYPNPVTHTLTVEIKLKEPAALQLNLVNSVGKDSGTWQLNEVSIFHKTELNLADLQGGVYLLQAQAGRQKVVKRVVKIQY